MPRSGRGTDEQAGISLPPGRRASQSELNDATGREGLHRVGLDGHAASVEDLEHGTTDYPYREIEYAYTYGQPPADSLASSFLSCIARGSGQDVVRTHGHLPCGTPVGLRICGTG
ncbi:hypothetical protein [Streptomyces triticiradicis]|uniref:hypothetical protein n=1 Tax=Streptomyces triticiradicis TaxID=2651189 RepID=UPI00384B9F11